VRWSAGTRRLARRTPVVGTFPRLLDQGNPQPISPRPWARGASSTVSRHGSLSPRQLPGPDDAGSAGAMSGATGSTSLPRRVGRSRRARAARALRRRPEERKGLPVLLTAFEALVEHVPSRLTIIGAEREDVLRYLADPKPCARSTCAGAFRREPLDFPAPSGPARAPSLSGESFAAGPHRAFAAWHAGDRLRQAGYSDVVKTGSTGCSSHRRPPAPRRGAATGSS